jgi:hypothetical protein
MLEQSERRDQMKPSPAVVRLSWLVALLAAVVSLAGLLWNGGEDGPVAATTIRGESVQLYGRGLYRYESLPNGAGFKGVDLYILAVCVPLLLIATYLYRRGSLRGGLLLAGTLAYLLYNASHQVFNYAYNHLFLVYLALFSASLFATVLAFISFGAEALPARFSAELPRRMVAGFLFAVGLSLTIVWVGLDILPALLQGRAPRLSGYTTLVTHAVDVGIIAPLAALAGVLLLRRVPPGELLAAIFLVFSSVLGVGVFALSAAQALAGLLTVAEMVVFVAPFIVLTVAALWLAAILLRRLGRPGMRAAYA